jgi:parvulin-like peptidyl-prolyl isomerase
MARPERIRVRQFLFDNGEAAGKARALIREGESPEEVVGRFAEGDVRPVTVDLGEVAREDLPEEIAAELFALKEGGVSTIFPREESFSLFLVVRKEPARTPTLASSGPEIREELLRARREQAFRSWLTGQVGKADIRIQETLLDQFAAEGGK